jgi:hypothetical protein
MTRTVLALTVGLVAAVGSCGERGTQKMETRVERDSISEVLRATHLAVVRLEQVNLGAWAREAEGPLMARSVDLVVALERVLKGRIRQPEGQSFPLQVRQRGTGSYRVADDYGLWSRLQPAAGQRLLAFCSGDTDDLALLLREERCEQLADAGLALPDAEAALALEAAELAPDRLVARAAPLFEQRGDILARYVWARARVRALEDAELFDSILRIAEAPRTSPRARETLLQTAYDDLGVTDKPPRAQLLRLARAMFTVLLLPEAAPLHANLCQVFLPNLLGLGRGRAEASAADVFADADELRTRAREAVRGLNEFDPDGQLLAWLSTR